MDLIWTNTYPFVSEVPVILLFLNQILRRNKRFLLALRMSSSRLAMPPGASQPFNMRSVRQCSNSVRLFLAFVRTAHYWTEIHPELVFEDDIKRLLNTHEVLAACVLSDPACQDDLSQQISAELSSLRDLKVRHEQLEENYETLSVDHQRTAAELREREEDLHYMIALSPQISWTADAGGCVQYIDPKWSRDYRSYE